ncbi:MAG: hypothetical protein A2359_03990 [Candidatus Moranbacteria bacterium RIFOXYB1_FULL_43_19]|nr:MAG: hypothetical protein A2184_04630 [Candidatus Moranbacteria bacterium RIFOXYA1_FULL_44_7]OGI27815.1 MAG: hypothetical protein A2359_03990 [Candidatus Moranbacteria bacterium RIFOXYB1_FULL_43_19]OGI34024.1 MAG: hypothetical protein A2420_02680 [Candidatus Moranbacteria bacterium RIFOXYC1_FULL_44_13]OGI37734.1 MAG: hypothetical protein A2612_03175 [Candidatus Moranbacteria bacterium RIFOXYD1_FULL_44_12]
MKSKKPKKAKRGAKLDDFLFDDCPICRAMKKANEQGKNLDGEDLLKAFAEANKKTKHSKMP